MITPSQVIKEREVASMTQADLSADSGVSLKAIEEFEAGKRLLNDTSLQALRAALDKARSTELCGVTIDPRKQGRGGELE
jgi:transcriptional regulator with XRE-family HTH domain